MRHSHFREFLHEYHVQIKSVLEFSFSSQVSCKPTLPLVELTQLRQSNRVELQLITVEWT